MILIPSRYRSTGSLLADASLWLLTAMTLAVFDVRKVVKDGVEITPEVDPSSGVVRYVFQCQC